LQELEKPLRESLFKIKTSTDVGVNQMTYRSLLIETKTQIDSNNLKKGLSKRIDALLSAFEAYQDALTVWEVKKQFEQLTINHVSISLIDNRINEKYGLTAYANLVLEKGKASNDPEMVDFYKNKQAQTLQFQKTEILSIIWVHAAKILAELNKE
jgi:hypothetical protein